MRIVVKLGSSLVATSKGAVRRSLLAARATEVAALVSGGHSVTATPLLRARLN